MCRLCHLPAFFERFSHIGGTLSYDGSPCGHRTEPAPWIPFRSLPCRIWSSEAKRPNVPNQCDQIGRYIGLCGKYLKPLSTINLPKSSTFLGNFCKGVKIYHFSSEIIFAGTFIDIWQFFSGHTAPNSTLISRSFVLVAMYLISR